MLIFKFLSNSNCNHTIVNSVKSVVILLLFFSEYAFSVQGDGNVSAVDALLMSVPFV